MRGPSTPRSLAQLFAPLMMPMMAIFSRGGGPWGGEPGRCEGREGPETPSAGAGARKPRPWGESPLGKWRGLPSEGTSGRRISASACQTAGAAGPAPPRGADGMGGGFMGWDHATMAMVRDNRSGCSRPPPPREKIAIIGIIGGAKSLETFVCRPPVRGRVERVDRPEERLSGHLLGGGPRKRGATTPGGLETGLRGG